MRNLFVCCVYVCNVFVYHRKHFNESMMNDLEKLKYSIEAAVAAAAAVVAAASPSSPLREMRIVAKKFEKKEKRTRCN